MKTIGYFLSGLMLVGALNSSAQTTDPDQNPNHARAAQKYADRSDLTATQSTTIQDTYEAYDWREAKAAEKQLRQDRRYELRKMRIQSRFNRGYYPYRYHNNMYYNNGYYNPGYYNGGFYNNGYGYYNTPYNYNYGYFGQPYCGTILGAAGLGLGLYNLFN